jgi:pimeloyl-ACP methyl ester carboxylesterase
MAFLVSNGFRLYYEDTGGNAPTILWLHGAGGNHLSWWQQVPVFAEEYRCITVDQRGFGQSPDIPDGPGPAVLWHAALGKTFRTAQPMRSFLYAQIAGVNPPRPADFSDQLSRLTTPVERYVAARVPTMFLTSDEDGLIWPELSKTVHDAVPGSRFQQVEAAGHSTYFERPDVFNREVGAFLKGYRP